MTVSFTVIRRGDTQIEILSQGEGPLIVLLPSLGRGAEDFAAIAERIAAAGFRVLRPQPRGIGRSHGPMSGIDLHDYANDVAAVIERANGGPAFVVGHAFGNRVARLLATTRPDLVRAVGLIAANVGRDPSPPKVREADYAAGHAPVLYLQPDHDPLAHVENAEAYRRALGARVTVVVIPHASHAAIAEQPDFIARELVAYARRLPA